MTQSTKKYLLSSALMVPVLSFTLFGSTRDFAYGESLDFLGKIVFSNKAQSGQISPLQVASNFDLRVIQLEEAVRGLTQQVETLQLAILRTQNRLDALEEQHLGRSSHILAEREKTVDETNVDKTDNTVVQHLPKEEIGEEETIHLPASILFDVQGQFLKEEEEEEETASFDADLPQIEDAKEFYRVGYQHMLSGDYKMAERVFRAFQTRFPDDEQVGDASFWLGEALYGQGRYREAAQVYIDVQKLHQDSPRGPENLLKLGMSMAQLNEIDIACKTLTEVPKRYSDTEPALLKQAVTEKERLRCP